MTKHKGDSSAPSSNPASQEHLGSNRDQDGGLAQDMSLRDYFAAAAMSSGDCPHNIYLTPGRAQWAYEQADAMLAERDK